MIKFQPVCSGLTCALDDRIFCSVIVRFSTYAIFNVVVMYLHKTLNFLATILSGFDKAMLFSVTAFSLM
jgi:hypothetical protein